MAKIALKIRKKGRRAIVFLLLFTVVVCARIADSTSIKQRVSAAPGGRMHAEAICSDDERDRWFINVVRHRLIRDESISIATVESGDFSMEWSDPNVLHLRTSDPPSGRLTFDDFTVIVDSPLR
jgi:hypothetical protein